VSEAGKGVLAMVGACTIWGLSGLYYKLLAHVPPLEVLCHRTLWSMVFFGAVLMVQRRAAEVRGVLGRRRVMAVLAVSVLMVSTNWFGFIYAIQAGRALEASLGYYVFPLVAVALGYLVFGERFSRGQAAAIGLAAVAVVVLTAGLGAAPWIALLLAVTFGLYGLIKKQVALGPVISVFLETLWIAPLAGLWLVGLHAGLWADPGGRPGAVFGQDLGTGALLMLSGPLTGGPLILFSYAARRVSYASLGLVQYLNPTLQFAVAVAVFGEAFTLWHAVAFPLIWAALALYSGETWRRDRAARAALRDPVRDEAPVPPGHG
jgi:chloramphenicol-sensitive protein RarD